MLNSQNLKFSIETQDSDSKKGIEGSSFSLLGSINNANLSNVTGISGQNLKGKLYSKKTSFNVKANRFEYKPDTTPGPGHYAGPKPCCNWNKKSFNILYAEL